MDYLKYLGYIKYGLLAVLVVALVYVWMPAPPPVLMTSKTLDAPIKRQTEQVEAAKTLAKKSVAVVAIARESAAKAKAAYRVYTGRSGKAQDEIDSALARRVGVDSSAPSATEVAPTVAPPAAVYVEKLEELTDAQDTHITNLDAVIQAEDSKDELLSAQNAQLKGEETQLQKEVKTEERKVFWAKVAIGIVLIAVGAHFLVPGAL